MALRGAMSGMNFAENAGITVAGIWASTSNVAVSSVAPAGASDTYAILMSTGSVTIPVLSATYAGLIAGYRLYVTTLPAATTPLIKFLDGSGNQQCDMRMNSVGQIIFTRNGTVIGSTSTFAFSPNAWYYIEFKALFSLSAGGTCEAKVNGAVVLTSTGLTNATGSAVGGQVTFASPSNSCYGRDFYWLDTAGGVDTTYLGDVTVGELYATGAGVHSQWSQFQPSFTLTSVATGTGVYQGTITNGASNAWQGYYFTVTGFGTGANNGTFLCTASSASSITLNNPSSASETHAGTAAFQNPIQEGIHGGLVDGGATTNVGTRPQNDNLQYIFDSTTNDQTDYAHQSMSLTGTIAGVVHIIYARKDDAGTRQIAQQCLSGATTETGATISLGSSYVYYLDVLEADPNTSAAWTLTAFNNATFGVKQLT